ncbi:MAG TPA: SRPBCC domain-containing protein [Steroidobacteraceae bacterium]|jgi:uncharacterized protein YndB with AHSA1/START domain
MQPANQVDEEVVVRRNMPIARERIFAAWLDPGIMAEFMKMPDCPDSVVEADPRVGGKFRIMMRHGKSGTEHWGEYLEIEPPSRLSFTWISVHTRRESTTVTVELIARGGGTEVILTHRKLPQMHDGHRGGWTQILGALEAKLSR